MSPARRAAVVLLLVAQVGLAALGGLVTYGLTAEYGDITKGRAGTFLDAMAAGTGGPAVALVVVLGVAAAGVGRTRGTVAVAAAVPALLVAWIWVSGPWAIEEKRDAVPAPPQERLGPASEHRPLAR